jgi:PAS domain S-box-containing protein
MLIEDSRTQAEHVRKLFANEGWDVLYAPNAEVALDQLNRTHPDLIVVDYYLPGKNGDEFCREIRMNVNTRGIPVLMLTVEGTHDAEMRGLESGADDYLAKSGDPDILLLRVRALLRKSRGPEAIVARAEISFSRARLLAIDDSPTYLEYLAQELEGEGYVVSKATAGKEGLERIRKEGFDGVLVDLEMPGMDGIEVCKAIGEIRRTTDMDTAVLMLTVHEDKGYMTRGLEAGADDFLGKSSDMAVLKARIRALLRRKFFMEENRRIVEELKDKELQAVRARAEKEAAEVRATMADRLAQSNRELEEANRKLSEALDVTRAITENAAEALFMMDAEGRTTFVNPAAERMFGYGREELLGQVLHDKIHSRHADGSPFPGADCLLYRSVAGTATITGHEGVFRRKDGTLVDVACSSAPIVQGGRTVAAVLVVHDISERKRAEEQLRQAQKLESVGLLAGGVAHDFNNILTSILGTASLIEEELPANASGKLSVIIEGAERAANLTRQLLAYAGKGQFVIEDLDISTLVREMLGLIRLSVPKSIEVRLDLQEGLPLISADPGQMQQVLMNLVINAGEAIGAGNHGRICLSTGSADIGEGFLDATAAELAAGQYVYLEVRDTGCGMDEHTKARMLDPFFTTKFTGRGLGLAAVSGIMRSQKGAITVESALGQGSAFRVLFPASANPAVARKDAASHERPAVLVIEDEEGVRGFLKSALERYGYTVLSAQDGREGLAMLDQHSSSIALVLLDLIMPVMGGQEVLAEIKRRQPGIKVLLTSGYNEAEAKRLCAAYGDTLFLQKPFSARSLIHKVQSAIAGA